MAKSILLFINQKPFGVFSNKTNCFKAIEKNVDVGDMVMEGYGTAFIPASYNQMVNKLGKVSKCRFYSNKAIEQSKIDGENGLPSTMVSPFVNVYQFETNTGIDGVIYKSNEEIE